MRLNALFRRHRADTVSFIQGAQLQRGESGRPGGCDCSHYIGSRTQVHDHGRYTWWSVASNAWGACPLLPACVRATTTKVWASARLRGTVASGFVVIWPSHLRLPSFVFIFYAFDGVLVLVPFHFLSSISDFYDYDMIGQPGSHQIAPRFGSASGFFAYEEQLGVRVRFCTYCTLR